jgi:hypothetical protein
VSWWSIDVLGFDQAFFSVLSLIASALTLIGMFMFRRFMAERSIIYVVGFLTAVSFVLSMPTLGMSMGLHEWTASVTGGVVDARFIAVIDTALESPLGTDFDDPDAGVDRQFGASTPEGDLLRRDGVLHQSRAVGQPARHQVPQPDLHAGARSEGSGHRCRRHRLPTTAT